MLLYNVKDPYDRNYRYFEEHYVCLWRVNKSEIIGTWKIDETGLHDAWYEDVIMPAFEAHEKRAIDVEGVHEFEELICGCFVFIDFGRN